MDKEIRKECIKKIKRASSLLFKKQKIDEYYEGLRKGLDIAESLFECSNFEVDERKN